MAESYSEPVAQFLTRGEPAFRESWPDYPARGLTREHVPELIRMATDPAFNELESESPEVWAPLHAWRALGQLGAEEAVEPLIRLLRKGYEDDDYAMEEVPKALGMIGGAAVQPAVDLLADTDADMIVRAIAGTTLQEIGKRHPELRDTAIAHLVRHLEESGEEVDYDGSELNGFVVSDLTHLKAVEALPVIKEAYRKGIVSQTVAGDYQDIEVDMGVRAERSLPVRYQGITLGPAPEAPEPDWSKVGRNDSCPCGSGLKFKKCCLKRVTAR